ncbi:MAG: Rpn family recombination-promoting nuclease/putative transposase [Myxococcota bacterium]|nr:Rpn family recombination-promoting nuclease/putative transposase [Myxococcota bacterium]
MMDYDHSYKLIFSHPRMVRELIESFVREDWVKRLDFETLEKVAASYVSDDLRERHDDVIWRARFGDEWLYLYILLEFQSKEEKFMAVRILTYLGLLYQDLVRGEQLTSSGKLPPVLPIVLYNGEPRWTAATEIFDLIENIPGRLARLSPRLQYLLIDEGAYAHAELASLKNLIAVLFQLEKTPLVDMGEKLIKRLFEWIGDNIELQRAFAVYLNHVYFKGNVDVDDIFDTAKGAKEVRAMLERNVDQWIEQLEARGKAKGIAEGEARGRAEGKAEGNKAARLRVAQKMIAAGMPISQVTEMTELSQEDVKQLLD